MSTKRALFVAPSYAPTTELQKELAEVGLLPKAFQKYIQKADIDLLRPLLCTRQFGDQDVVELVGVVTLERLRCALKQLLTPSTEETVAVMIYLCHGVREFSSLQGTVCLSHGKKASGYWIQEQINAAQFRGTLLEVYSMCHAEGLPPFHLGDSLHIGRGQALDDQVDGVGSTLGTLDEEGSTVNCKRITLFASESSAISSGNSSGSSLIKTMIKILTECNSVGYRQFGDLLQAESKGFKYRNSGNYSGDFLAPAEITVRAKMRFPAYGHGYVYTSDEDDELL